MPIPFETMEPWPFFEEVTPTRTITTRSVDMGSVPDLHLQWKSNLIFD